MYFSAEFKNGFVDNFRNQGLKVYDHTYNQINNSQLNANNIYVGCVPVKGSAGLPFLNSRFKVVLTPDASQVFDGIKSQMVNYNNQRQQIEIGFVMIGDERPDGIIVISAIWQNDESERKEREVSHDGRRLDSIVKYQKKQCEIEGKKPFVIFGHTHPAQNYPNYCANSWSLGDFYASYCESDRYKNDCQVAHLLITPSLDTNLMFYDRNVKQFYRFAEGIYQVDKSDNVTINPAYSGLDKNPIKTNGSYWG